MIQTYEEKESDVRIATQIVNDANNHNCDVAIVVSADSDMLPAIELALESGTKVFVYFPPFHHSNSLSNISSSRVINLERYESRFRQCIMPDTVHLSLPDFDPENLSSDSVSKRMFVPMRGVFEMGSIFLIKIWTII